MILNYRNIPTVFASIFKGAFSPVSVTGGAVGSFFMSMKKVFPEESSLMKQDLVPVRLLMHVRIQESL